MSGKTIGFVVPPLTGHVNPLGSVARQLTQRGHRVVWIGHIGRISHLLPAGSETIALDESGTDRLEREVRERANQTRGLAAYKLLFEEFLLPLARGMMGEVERAVLELKPHGLVVDQQALAGAMVARKHGIPWLTSATTSAALIDPFAMVPNVQNWMIQQFRELQEEGGLLPVDRPDFSPPGILAFTTRAFMGETSGIPEQTCFVGPSIARRPGTHDFPFEKIRDKGAILVSVGTLNQERSRRFFQVAAEALANVGRPVVAVAPQDLLPEWPDSFVVQPYIPQLEVLPHCSAVISHGGHNTVVESLLAGLPLVVAPIRDDQPVIAGQVVGSGAGVRVHFGRVRPSALLEAVERVLGEPSFREAALHLADGFRTAGGAQKAADHVEDLWRS